MVLARIKAGVLAILILAVSGGTALCGCAGQVPDADTPEDTKIGAMDKVVRTEEEWKRILPPDRYKVLRQKGTEPPFSGEYDDYWEDGVYACYACGLPLFDSRTKFHSGSGWPSFWEPLAPEAVEEHTDTSYDMKRVEVTCARCGGHLGHVFTDGPEPSGLRYCINSLALKFVGR